MLVVRPFISLAHTGAKWAQGAKSPGTVVSFPGKSSQTNGLRPGNTWGVIVSSVLTQFDTRQISHMHINASDMQISYLVYSEELRNAVNEI